MDTKRNAVFFIMANDFMGMEEAILRHEQGYDVYLIACDEKVGICQRNPFASKCRCKFCAYTTKDICTRYFKKNKNIHFMFFSSLVTNQMVEESKQISFKYNNVQELKSLSFQGSEIGFGAFSTFATVTRNVMPTINRAFREYIDTILRSEIVECLAIDKFLKSLKPDLLVFHNGRFNNFKPLYNYAVNHKVDFIATETDISSSGMMMKNNFYNDIPHSYEALHTKIELAWKAAGDKGEEIGRSFYENRRNAKPAGDKIYIKHQKQGELPQGFDKSTYNIAIFNSSEDEFCAISKEYDESQLFENQFVALKTIFDHYKEDKGIHFYLRIHPNLEKVPFKSHTMLYDLKYDNVTIIPPSSPISSYSLMDASDKVIVFNSTMGMESSYWGKPVIALCKSFYTKLNIVYEPTTVESLFSLVNDRELQPKGDKRKCYMGACYCLGYGNEDFLILKNRIGYWHGETFTLKTLLGSSKLHTFITRFLEKSSLLYGNGRKYKNIAKETA